jgi:hypothetical protein
MTLTEFLLARIAEDEKIGHSREWHEEMCDWCSPDPDDGGRFPCDCKVPARVLAECAAKRRIVEANRHWGGVADANWEQRDAGVADGLEDAMRLLAAVYDSHSDYDEAWRL